MSVTHVALLRGVNVGRSNRLAMGTLREVATGLGWQQVSTVIQSGNLLFRAAGTSAEHAAALHQALLGATGLDLAVVVLTATQVQALDRDCPWPDVADPRQVHAYLHLAPLSAPARDAVGAAAAAARRAGGQDELAVRGRVVYLRTPAGFAASALPTLLDRAPVRRVTGPATARNLATVRRLAAAVQADPPDPKPG